MIYNTMKLVPFILQKINLQLSNGSPPASASSTTTVHNSSDASSQEKITKQCILCGSKDKQMSRYINWGSTERKILSTYLDSTPSENSFICKSHLMEARRHYNNPDFIPKWKSGPRGISKPLKTGKRKGTVGQHACVRDV